MGCEGVVGTEHVQHIFCLKHINAPKHLNTQRKRTCFQHRFSNSLASASAAAVVVDDGDDDRLGDEVVPEVGDAIVILTDEAVAPVA